MALRLVQVIDSPDPRAGQIHSVLPGLLDSLLNLEVESDLLAIDSHQTPQVRRWRKDRIEEDWNALVVPDIPHLLREANIIHFHGINRLQFKPLHKAIRQGKIPYVISPHSALLPNPWKQTSLMEKIRSFLGGDHRCYRSAASLHATIPQEEECLREKNLNSRIETIPLGVSLNNDTTADTLALEETHPQIANKRCLLYLGPLDPVEGLVPMLKACETALYGAKEWHLILAGNISRNWLEMIQAVLERRKLSDRATFLVDPDQAMQKVLLNHCAVIIQPSLLARSPISALSGLANKKPCIVSNKCDLKDVNRTHSGWEAEPARLSLSSTLEQVIQTTPQELRQMGIRGYEWVKANRTWDVLAPLYKKYYTSLIP